jgi:hypothetical protein
MKDENKVGFLHGIFGLSVTPVSTAERLIKEQFPRHIFTMMLAILLTIFLPFVAEINVRQLDDYRTDIISSILIIIFFTYVIFSIVEMLFLQIIGIDIRLNKMMATTVYAFVPLMVACWMVFITNWFFNGSITLVTKVLTLRGDIDPNVLEVLNIGLYYSICFAVLIFASCIKTITQGSLISALFVTIISLVPMYICLILGVSLAEMALPGTLESVLKISPLIDTLGKIYRQI